MRYVNIVTNEVKGINDIRGEFPGVSIPEIEDLSTFGYGLLVAVAKPVVSVGQYAIEVGPIDGVQQWSVVDVPIVVPSSVSPRQARLQLIVLGKIELVDTAIESLSEPDKSIAKVEWEYATKYEITHPFVVQMLGLLEIDKEEFFLAASRL